jgi:hypothetical protein
MISIIPIWIVSSLFKATDYYFVIFTIPVILDAYLFFALKFASDFFTVNDMVEVSPKQASQMVSLSNMYPVLNEYRNNVIKMSREFFVCEYKAFVNYEKNAINDERLKTLYKAN